MPLSSHNNSAHGVREPKFRGCLHLIRKTYLHLLGSILTTSMMRSACNRFDATEVCIGSFSALIISLPCDLSRFHFSVVDVLDNLH